MLRLNLRNLTILKRWSTGQIIGNVIFMPEDMIGFDWCCHQLIKSFNWEEKSLRQLTMVAKYLDDNKTEVQLIFKCSVVKLWRGILDKNVIGSYRKVHYIEFACILPYGTRYAVMSYSVMLYSNRSTVISYSVTLYRNQNSIVSYSKADVSPGSHRS